MQDWLFKMRDCEHCIDAEIKLSFTAWALCSSDTAGSYKTSRIHRHMQRVTIIFEYLISLLELILMSGYGPLHSLGLAEG